MAATFVVLGKTELGLGKNAGEEEIGMWVFNCNFTYKIRKF